MRHGLGLRPRRIPFKHLFDLRGSTLFERVVETPAHYLTRTELHVMNDHAPAIAQRMGPRPELIEWNAGPLRLVRRLIEEMDQPVRYLPIDISGQHLQACASGLQHDYPALAIEPIVGDFTCGGPELPLPHPEARRRIGLLGRAALCAMPEAEAQAVLTRLAQLLPGGALLLSIDLVQDPALLLPAYNDPQGAMAQLHLHLLERCNRELGGHFHLPHFRHEALYDPTRRFLELRLVSTRAQEVLVDGQLQVFAEGEPLRTLRRPSYTLEQAAALARRAGWTLATHWTDARQRVALCWLQPTLSGPTTMM